MQKQLTTLLVCTACLLGQKVVADNYSTEATMSLQKDESILNVEVRVSRLSQQDGELVEQLVAAPRITTPLGGPSTMTISPQPNDPGYASKEKVKVDVSWPYPNESGVAICAVTIQRGNEVVSKSRLQLKIEGPGRMPLVIAARDVNPKSVQVVEKTFTEEKSAIYLLFELAGKTKQEVKKLAAENYGNKVQIMDLHGSLTEGGLSFGAYHEVGLTLEFKSKDEAEKTASLLQREGGK